MALSTRPEGEQKNESKGFDSALDQIQQTAGNDDLKIMLCGKVVELKHHLQHDVDCKMLEQEKFNGIANDVCDLITAYKKCDKNKLHEIDEKLQDRLHYSSKARRLAGMIIGIVIGALMFSLLIAAVASLPGGAGVALIALTVILGLLWAGMLGALVENIVTDDSSYGERACVLREVENNACRFFRPSNNSAGRPAANDIQSVVVPPSEKAAAAPAP